MHIFWGLGCKHIFWGTTIQSAADVSPQRVGLPEGSLCYHLSQGPALPTVSFHGQPVSKTDQSGYKGQASLAQPGTTPQNHSSFSP